MPKRILTHVLVFTLVLLITASISFTIISMTLLNKNLVFSVLAEEDYYTKTYGYIMEKFKDNTVQSGLEESILDGIITEDSIAKDVRSLVDYIYTGKKLEVDRDYVTNNLREKINKVIEENNKKVLADEQKAINIYIKTIGDIYENGVILSSEYVSEAHSIIAKTTKTVNRIMVILYIATIADIIAIAILKRKRCLKFYGIALISSGLLLIIPKIIESIALNTKYILLFTQALSQVAISLIETVMFRFLAMGIALIILGFLFNLLHYAKYKFK